MTVAFIGLLILSIMFIALRTVGMILIVPIMGALVQSFGLTLLGKNKKSFADTVVMGFVFTLAVSQLLLVTTVLYDVHVLTATLWWWGIFLALSIYTIIRCKGETFAALASVPRKIKAFVIEKKCGGVYGILATLLIAAQLIGSILLYHYDDDDSVYVTSVASNVVDDHFWQVYGPTGEDTTLWSMSEYLTNGWYALLTVISKSLKIPAAVLMHTVLPVMMIAIAYAVVFIFAKILIKKENQRYIFLIFVSLINIFNNVSSHTSSSILLMRMHQGKALFANIIIPLMFCVFLLMWDQLENKKNLWILAIANTCACAFSTSGLVFGAMLTVLFAGVYGIHKKSIKSVFFTVLTILPNIVYAAAYVLERLFEVWVC